MFSVHMENVMSARKVIALQNVPVDALNQRALRLHLRAALARIAELEAALEEAGGEIDRQREQLAEVEALLGADPKGRSLAGRVHGLLVTLADACELLDLETSRVVPMERLTERRARLVRLLGRLGPYRPQDARKVA
jgi:hypothetical protein